MNKKDKKEIMEIVCGAIEKITMPVLDNVLENQQEIKKELKTKSSSEEVAERFDEVDNRLDNIDRKLDSTITRVDRHDVLMKK